MKALKIALTIDSFTMAVFAFPWWIIEHGSSGRNMGYPMIVFLLGGIGIIIGGIGFFRLHDIGEHRRSLIFGMVGLSPLAIGILSLAYAIHFRGYTMIH